MKKLCNQHLILLVFFKRLLFWFDFDRDSAKIYLKTHSLNLDFITRRLRSALYDVIAVCS